jgi:ribosomal protein S18 acetylase RimI-like enzyme
MPARAPLIRRATRADLARIGELGAMLVAAHHTFDARRFLEATSGTKQGYAAYLRTQLGAPGAAVFVADDEGAVLGYAYVAVESYDYMSLRGPAGIVHDLIVDPASRGRGIGRALLAAAFEYFRSERMTQVVLGTAEKNAAAQRFFASAGFRPTMIEMTREL